MATGIMTRENCTFLLILGLFILTDSQGKERPRCDPESEFLCRHTDECIRIESLCDGVDHCLDGSDEDPKDACQIKASMGAVLHVGDSATVETEKLGESYEYNGIKFLMCDQARSCNVGTVLLKSNYLYAARLEEECDLQGNNCKRETDKTNELDFGAEALSSNFRVHRFDHGLQIYAIGGGHFRYELPVLTVPAAKTFTRFQARPWMWFEKITVNVKSNNPCAAELSADKYQSVKRVQLSYNDFQYEATELPAADAQPVAKRAVRVSDKTLCGIHASECKIGRARQISQGTSQSTGSGTSNSVGFGFSTSLGVNALPGTDGELSVSYTYQHDSSQSQSHGQSDTTTDNKSMICHIFGNHTGWIEVMPEYYDVVERVFRVWGGVCHLVESRPKQVPKRNGDGSIAGVRKCVSQDGLIEWQAAKL